MKIVQAHKYFWKRDGASNYMLELSDLLKERNHEVFPFSCKQKESLSSPQKKYFVDYFNLSDPSKLGYKEKAIALTHFFYSNQARKQFERLVREYKPNVLHIHNIYHHISPSILPIAKKYGLKVVMTLHDYKLICPNYSLFHHGEVHEEDAKGLYLSCIGNKCVKDSRVQSAVSVASMIWNHKIMKYYEKYIDKFIAPSEFMLNLCVKHGWDRKKFVHITNPVNTDRFKYSNKEGDRVLFVGRLSEEKGLDVLLESAKLNSDIPHTIVGTGPLESELKNKIKKDKITNVKMVGFQTGNKLVNYLKSARIMVAPSIWYENAPLSILEAKSMGKIVVASKIGGIPELLPKDMLVSPNDPADLAKKIKLWYISGSEKRRIRGLKLSKEVVRKNNSEDHVSAIEALYKKL